MVGVVQVRGAVVGATVVEGTTVLGAAVGVDGTEVEEAVDCVVAGSSVVATAPPSPHAARISRRAVGDGQLLHGWMKQPPTSLRLGP